jgi:hypothetical protein
MLDIDCVVDGSAEVDDDAASMRAASLTRDDDEADEALLPPAEAPCKRPVDVAARPAGRVADPETVLDVARLIRRRASRQVESGKQRGSKV